MERRNRSREALTHSGLRRGMGQLRSSLRSLAAVFGNLDLARLMIGWAGMTVTTWVFALALGVYAFDVGGATAVGVAALVRLLPGALASPFAGLLGDRRSRRWVLIASAVGGAAVLAAAAAAVALDAPAAAVFALAGLFTVAISPYVPAEGALMPVVARTPQELSAANVAHSVMDNLGFLLGALVAGALLTVASPDAVFGVAALAGAVSVGLLVGLGPDARPVYAAGP